MKVFKNKFHEWSFKTCYIKDPIEAKKACDILLSSSRLFGLDLETAKRPEYIDHPKAGLDPHLSLIRLVQIYDGIDTVWVFDMFHVGFDVVKEMLQKGHFVSHNALFELTHLTFNKIPGVNAGCSMLLSQIIDGAEHSPFEPEEEDEDDDEQTGLSRYRKKGHSLDVCVQRLFGVKVEKKLQVSDWGKLELDKEQITYAGLDAVLTYKVAKELVPKISQYKMQKAYRLLKDMQTVVASMAIKGLPVDWKYHRKLMAEWEIAKEEALEKCKPFFTYNGELINLRSSKQMGEWLQRYLKDAPVDLHSWPKTSKGSYAFGKNVIASFTKYPAVKVLLEYKKYAKLLDTYGESLVEKRHPVTGNLHTSYTLGQTRTGRLSSRDPNLQNQPHDKHFRRMFKAPDGYCIIAGDYNSIELRIQAELSQDPVMLEVFRTGGDIYKKTASAFLHISPDKITDEQRTIGKVISLSLGFGMGPTKLGMYAFNGFGVVKSQLEWDKAHKMYHTLYNVYSRWCDRIRERAKILGYAETILGKRRKLEESEIYTAAPNSCVQGSAAELMMTALIIAEKNLEGIADVIGSIHDEVLIISSIENSSKAKEILTESMNDSMRKIFPRAVSFDVAKVKIADNWGDAK